MTKQIHKCISLLKRQTNRCIVASTHDTFQTNVSYDMPLNKTWTIFNKYIDRWGQRSPFLLHCAAPLFPARCRRAAARLSHPQHGCIQAWHLHRKFKTSGAQVVLCMRCFQYEFYQVHCIYCKLGVTEQCDCGVPGVSSDRGKLDFFLAVFRGTSRQINSSLSNERVVALPVHETYLARYIIYRSGDVPCSGGSTNRRS